jgi:hypothetical protein
MAMLMTPTPVAVVVGIAGGDLTNSAARGHSPPHRHHPITFFIILRRRLTPELRPSSLNSNRAVSAARRPLKHRLPFTRAPPVFSSSISVVVAPPTTPRRLHHLFDQVNLPDPIASAADAPPPQPSSASPSRINRPRRRRTSNGSATATHRSIRLVEAELMTPAPAAAVAGIAGDVGAGGGRIQIDAGAGARSDPLNGSDPLSAGPAH